MILVDKFNNEYRVGSIVTENNRATGRKREGWEIASTIERAGTLVVEIRRDCPHKESQDRCRENWCKGEYRKWVAPHTIGLKAVNNVGCEAT